MQVIKLKDCQTFSAEKKGATKSICTAYGKKIKKVQLEKLIKLDHWNLLEKTLEKWVHMDLMKLHKAKLGL